MTEKVQNPQWLLGFTKEVQWKVSNIWRGNFILNEVFSARNGCSSCHYECFWNFRRIRDIFHPCPSSHGVNSLFQTHLHYWNYALWFRWRSCLQRTRRRECTWHPLFSNECTGQLSALFSHQHNLTSHRCCIEELAGWRLANARSACVRLLHSHVDFCWVMWRIQGCTACVKTANLFGISA